MPATERTPREQETLVYQTPQEAQQLTERIKLRVEQQQQTGQVAPREVIGEIVADELAMHGHGVSTLSQPWEHTEAEHTEAQQLLDVAFDRDLSVALTKARASKHYPRNLDLFHDVLTNELYQMIVQHKLNRQPLVGWGFLLIVIVLVGLLGVLAFIVL